MPEFGCWRVRAGSRAEVVAALAHRLAEGPVPRDLGVRYFGLCCGAALHHVRSMAEALGRTPPASRYSADMSKHTFLGNDATLRQHNLQYRDQL